LQVQRGGGADGLIVPNHQNDWNDGSVDQKQDFDLAKPPQTKNCSKGVLRAQHVSLVFIQYLIYAFVSCKKLNIIILMIFYQIRLGLILYSWYDFLVFLCANVGLNTNQ
jgi:hypothetical protein